MATTTKNMQVVAGNANASVTAQVTDSMPGVPCPGPAGYTYKGLRYVPVFADPAEWSSANSYEALTVVMHEGNSYTSKQAVPVGVDISNETFWALTGNYNAQVEQYRQEVKAIGNKWFVQYSDQLSVYTTPEVYGAKGDGLTDDSTAFKSAIASGLPIIITKTYMISETLVVNNQGLIIKGQGSAGTTPRIEYTGNGILFDVNVSQFAFSNFNIHSNTTMTGTAINCSDVNGNVDSLCTNVAFGGFEKAIEVTGRNIKCTECIFGDCKHAIWQNTSITGETRDVVVYNSRFHGVGTIEPSAEWSDNYCIVLADGETPRNIICDNYFDGCAGLIKGNLQGLSFIGNTVFEQYGGNSVIMGTNTEDTLPFQIVSNVFNTRFSPNDKFHANTWVQSNSSGIITSNTFNGCYSTAIIINSVPIVIEGNTFSKMPSATYIINDSIGGSVIKGNVIYNTNNAILINAAGVNPSYVMDNLVNGRHIGYITPTSSYEVTTPVSPGSYIDNAGFSKVIALVGTTLVEIPVFKADAGGTVCGVSYYAENSFYCVIGTVQKSSSNHTAIRIDRVFSNASGTITNSTISKYWLVD